MPSVWLDLVVAVLAPLLGALGSLLIAYVSAWVRVHVQQIELQSAIDRALLAVEAAVADVGATYVAAARKRAADGHLSAEDAQHAKALAIARAREYLGDRGAKAVRQVIGDETGGLDRWIAGLIEAEISRSKR